MKHYSNDELCDIIQNACQLINGFKPDAVEGNYWSDWDESVLQSLIEILRRLQPVYGWKQEQTFSQWGWTELKEGNPLPDYDEPTLWLYEDGSVYVDSLDKDGNPWIFEGFKNPLTPDHPPIRCTHWHKLPDLPGGKKW